MHITPEQVHDIINSHDGNQDTRIASFSEIQSTSYSYTPSWTSYYITLVNVDRSYLLLVSSLPPTYPPSNIGPITLPALSILLTKILDHTTVPVPRPVALDESGGKWPFGWLLLRVPGSPAHPLRSLASVRHQLSPKQLARIELRLGTYLGALHGITNDWFGVPVDKPDPEPPSVPSLAALLAAQTDEDGEDMTPYSWQDTFVLRLEELLEGIGGISGCVDVDELRRCLTRAIGSFLFEDVEVPRLIWVGGNDEDVVVSLGSEQGPEHDTEADIAFLLPTFGHALWGDPLMETWFMPPGPTGALKKGYFGGEEDGTLIVFPRQKTKRVWYTVYLALSVLGWETRETCSRKSIQWARGILPECVETLKNAPCY